MLKMRTCFIKVITRLVKEMIRMPYLMQQTSIDDKGYADRPHQKPPINNHEPID